MVPVVPSLPDREDRHEGVVGRQDVLVPGARAEHVADRVHAPGGMQQPHVVYRRVEVPGQEAAGQHVTVHEGWVTGTRYLAAGSTSQRRF